MNEMIFKVEINIKYESLLIKLNLAQGHKYRALEKKNSQKDF